MQSSQQSSVYLSRQYQFGILFITILSWISWPYCFDIPQGVQTQLKSQPYSLSISEFNNIYVIGSLPNVILTFVNAWITLKVGALNGAVIYALTIGVSQLIMVIAIYGNFSGWYGVFMIGRLLLGFAGYATTSANLSIISKYAQPKLMPLLIGIGSMVPWTFQALSDVLTPFMYEISKEVVVPFIFGSFISIISIGMSLFMYYTISKLQSKAPEGLPQDHPIKHIKDLTKLGPVMLAMFLTLFFAVSIEGSIIINANDMLHERVGFNNVQAGTIVMMTMLINGPVTPIWALIKNKIEKQRILFVVIGGVLFLDILVLYLLPGEVSGLSFFMAYLGFILLGVWDSGAVTVIVGSIPLVVGPELLPLGFSIYTSSLALGLGLAPIITAAIINSSPNEKEGYKNTYYLYFIQFALAFIGMLYLWLSQNKQALKLESENCRKKEQLQILGPEDDQQ